MPNKHDHAEAAGQLPTPTHQKPTKHAWMTRDRPPTWTPLSSQSVWSPLPDSFVALAFQLSGRVAVRPRPPLAIEISAPCSATARC